MKSLLRFALTVAVTLSIASVANAQYPGGTGTTGATDGSGRGTGSAGVQTGGGPDTLQPGSPQPINIFAPQSNVTTTTTTTTTAGGEKKQKAHKRSKKTTKKSQTNASPSPSASR